MIRQNNRKDPQKTMDCIIYPPVLCHSECKLSQSEMADVIPIVKHLGALTEQQGHGLGVQYHACLQTQTYGVLSVACYFWYLVFPHCEQLGYSAQMLINHTHMLTQTSR